MRVKPSMRGKHWEDGWLTARWKQYEGSPDIVYSYPNKPDGSLLCYVFGTVDCGTGRTLLKELEERGYDLGTLQFAIRRKEATSLPTYQKDQKE